MKRIHLFAAIGVSALLSACATHSHSLVEGGSPGFLRGEFWHNGDTRLVLETTTERYVADGFKIERHQNLAELSRRYRGSNPKHWHQIIARQDKDHETLSADIVAVGSDGARLECRFAWSAKSAPAGHCRDTFGRELTVRFE